MKKVKGWSCDLWDYCSVTNCPNYYNCEIIKEDKKEGDSN